MLEGRVLSVLGGDNLLVEIDGVVQNVDLANIYPAVSGPENWDQLAAQRLTELLPAGTPVMIDPAWVSGEQLYAYVYGPTGLVNLELLREGLSVPRGQPLDGPIHEWYTLAVSEAQANSVGYWQYDTTMAQTSAGGSSFNLAALAPAIPARAAYWGVGTLTAVATLIAVGHVWRRWIRRPMRMLQRQLQHLQQDLTRALTEQKSLQRQYDQVTQQVQDWLNRAEAAVRNGDDEQARSALIQKKQKATEAESIQLLLTQAESQVMDLRLTITSVEGQLQQVRPQR
jgi:endonuclease YncB( thermonuclease family)